MKPLEGFRVLEVAMYGFVPACGAVLREWGAEAVVEADVGIQAGLDDRSGTRGGTTTLGEHLPRGVHEFAMRNIAVCAQK